MIKIEFDEFSTSLFDDSEFGTFIEELTESKIYGKRTFINLCSIMDSLIDLFEPESFTVTINVNTSPFVLFEFKKGMVDTRISFEITTKAKEMIGSYRAQDLASPLSTSGITMVNMSLDSLQSAPIATNFLNDVMKLYIEHPGAAWVTLPEENMDQFIIPINDKIAIDLTIHVSDRENKFAGIKAH